MKIGIGKFYISLFKYEYLQTETHHKDEILHPNSTEWMFNAFEIFVMQSRTTYEGESNENRKTEIKIRNIAPLSYKLADMLAML
jgi:hypothetical protein